MSYETGPYVQTACFCENVIVDNAGAISLIRIIDTLTNTVQGPEAPTSMPPISPALKLVIMLKSGDARGRSDISITPEGPDGLQRDPIIASVQFDGEERGANFITTLNVTFNQEGLHWFHIDVDRRRVTSMPFRIRYNRIVNQQVAQE